jgi:hypothetical protein
MIVNNDAPTTRRNFLGNPVKFGKSRIQLSVYILKGKFRVDYFRGFILRWPQMALPTLYNFSSDDNILCWTLGYRTYTRDMQSLGQALLWLIVLTCVNLLFFQVIVNSDRSGVGVFSQDPVAEL